MSYKISWRHCQPTKIAISSADFFVEYALVDKTKNGSIRAKQSVAHNVAHNVAHINVIPRFQIYKMTVKLDHWV